VQLTLAGTAAASPVPAASAALVTTSAMTATMVRTRRITCLLPGGETV
jgi:hypothetical protein